MILPYGTVVLQEIGSSTLGEKIEQVTRFIIIINSLTRIKKFGEEITTSPLGGVFNKDEFKKTITDPDEKDSIEHCHSSDYKYESYFAFGQNYDFTQNGSLNHFNAVSI